MSKDMHNRKTVAFDDLLHEPAPSASRHEENAGASSEYPPAEDRFQAWQQMQQQTQSGQAPPPYDPYGYPEQPEPEHKNNAPMIIAIVLAAITVLGALGFFGYLLLTRDQDNNDSKPATVPATAAMSPPQVSVPTQADNQPVRQVTMPDVNGLSESDAYQRLNEAGVKYRVSRAYSDITASGYVIKQTPDAGAAVPSNEEAVIFISKGSQSSAVFTPETTEPTSSDATADTTSPHRKSGDYLLPHSDSTYLGEGDLESFDRETLNLALNEIYARHGRKFSDPTISAYFNSKSWYHGTIAPSDFDSTTLNTFEQYNIQFITAYQAQRGYR